MRVTTGITVLRALLYCHSLELEVQLQDYKTHKKGVRNHVRTIKQCSLSVSLISNLLQNIKLLVRIRKKY